MGLSQRVGRERDHPVIATLRRQRGSQLPADAVIRGGRKLARCGGPVWTRSQSDGLGFREVGHEILSGQFF
jgi:hypothetical protein